MTAWQIPMPVGVQSSSLSAITSALFRQRTATVLVNLAPAVSRRFGERWPELTDV
jgi:hypothetical protein